MLLKRIQLGFLHVAVAMTLVPINSTLNRVMIKEFALSATLVAVLASLPYLFSPLQVAIGSFSDRHPLFGWRRTPYIFLGLVLCVFGVVIAPRAAFIMADNFWQGIGLGLLAFGAWGMGYNFASVSYLSLASEISGEKGRSRTVAVMFFMMILSIIVTAIGLSRMVDPYTFQAMSRAFRLVGITALFLGIMGLIRLEERQGTGEKPGAESYTWLHLTRTVLKNRQATVFFVYLIILLAAILGQDILLEPFGAEAFGMSVKATTRITSVWGTCMLVALIIAGALEGKVLKRVLAQWGGLGALAGFLLIISSGLVLNQRLFYSGVVLLGFGTGFSTVSNLSLMLDMTTARNVGLFIGAWGVANALSRLIGTLLAGMVRDAITLFSHQVLVGYIFVFGIEAGMLLVSLWLLGRINVRTFRQQAEKMDLLERAAIANDMS